MLIWHTFFRVNVTLKVQSHEIVGKMWAWGVSLGPK
jgi:hypothetical protein